jgi:DNA-directed RNA polymerase subunit RPC12/RpoP
MDIIFNCPNCDQELAVDAEGSGSQINCPACGQRLTIPSPEKTTTDSLPLVPPPVNAPTGTQPAAAAPKKELRLKVPVRDTPGEVLIGKAKPPLEAVQKGADKRLRIRTIRRASCIESGHDHFDERVSEFLQEVGEANLVGVHAVSYEYFDVGVQKVLIDYGLLIVFRG